MSDFRERLIHALGVEAYNKMLEKIDEIQLLLPFIIERLEQTKKELEELQHEKKKRPDKLPSKK